MSDLRYTDYARRLHLTATDVADNEKAVSDLRNAINDLAEPPQYFGEELAELAKTLARLKKEVIDSFNALEKKSKNSVDSPPPPQ